MTGTATLIEYNVLFSNKPTVIVGDLIKLSKLGSRMTVNEASQNHDATIATFCKQTGWIQCAEAESDRILVNPKIWAPDDFQDKRQISESARSAGLDIKFNPARWLTWAGLTHRPTKTRHLQYGTHLIAGYAKPEGAFTDRVEAFKNDAAFDAAMAILDITATHMRRHPEYLFHELDGDMNVQQRNSSEWWYPTRLWDGIWVPDTMPRQIDHMLHSRVSTDNGMRVTKRWTMGPEDGLDSDHRAQLKRVTW